MQLATYFNQKIMTYTNFQRKMPILHVMVNNQVFDAINIKRHHLIELSMNFNWVFVSSLYIKKNGSDLACPLSDKKQSEYALAS